MDIWQKNLKSIRESRGINKAELARRAGLTSGLISRYEEEEGKKHTQTTMEKLAAALECSVEDFFVIEQTEARLTPNIFPGPPILRKIPVISWVQAGGWTEVVDPYQPGPEAGG